MRWVQLAEVARLGLPQDACQEPPTASLHRGVAPSRLRETRRASRPPPTSASPLAATCCKTPRRRCRMPQPTQRLDPAGDVEQLLCAYSCSASASIPTFRYAPAQFSGHSRLLACLNGYSDVTGGGAREAQDGGLPRPAR